MRSKAIIVLILILLAGNVFFGIQYARSTQALRAAQTKLQSSATNEKVLKFTKYFITEILNVQKEIDFRQYAKLQNDIDDIGDKEIQKQWDRFVSSKTEAEGQDNTKKLLEILVNKIIPLVGTSTPVSGQ